MIRRNRRRRQRFMIETLESRQLFAGGPSLPLPIEAMSHPYFVAFVNSLPPIASHAVEIQAVQGQQFSGTVARVTGYNSSDLNPLAASINWGDGSTTVGSLVLNANGDILVTGDHTYNATGLFAVSVTVSQKTGPTTAKAIVPVIKSGAVVNPAGTGGLTLTENVSRPFTTSLGTFNFGNDNLLLSGTINWGDGTTSDAILRRGDGDIVTVIGSHTYDRKGTFNVKTTIKSATTSGTPGGAAGTTLSTNVADLTTTIYALPS